MKIDSCAEINKVIIIDGSEPASGTSIGGAFNVTINGINVRCVKQRSPVTQFCLILDVWSLELT